MLAATGTEVITGTPGRYWHRLDDGRVQCDVCPHLCRLHEGQRGLCFVRARHGSCMVLTCIAPGSLDNGLRYAARLKVCSSHAARASSGLRWPFFSISHSAL